MIPTESWMCEICLQVLSAVFVTWDTLTALMNESSSGYALRDAGVWRSTGDELQTGRMEGWASSTASATLISPQWRSYTFLLCLYKKVLSKCPAPHAAQQQVCVSKCSPQGDMQLADPSFPHSDNFTELNKIPVWNIPAFFSCMLCSCSKQGWQVTAGCDTLMVHYERGSQESGSSLRQTCCCSRSAYSSFSPALSPARGYNLTEEMIIFVPWQTRPELWNSGCRLAPLHPFPGLEEQLSCAPMGIPISQHFIAVKMPIIRNSGSL